MTLLSGPITAPGLYDLSADAYHADPCPEPSVSHSIARLLIDRSPLHASKAHPRITPGPREETKRRDDMALGTAAHKLTLGKGKSLIVIDADDFRTKAAREARDEAAAQGLTPILRADYQTAEAMAPLARQALESWLGGSLNGAHVEATAAALEGKFWRRAMMDVVTPDLRCIIDYKTTEDASVEAAERRIFGNGYDTQAAFYMHMLDLLDPAGKGQRRVVFLFQERDCPEALSLHELDAAAMELAEHRMKIARGRWDKCLAAGKWPGYEPGPHLVSPKPWMLADDIDATYEDAFEAA